MKEADDQRLICGIIQLDDVYWGCKRGHGTEGKTPSISAVGLSPDDHPISMRMTVVEGFKSRAIGAWAKRHLASGSVVLSGGLACVKAVTEANYEHHGFIRGGNLTLLNHSV